uniref:Uncharacterized protein n=1 Tax=Hucho hucho TaxID=62062 RepID=A0A4W5L9A1_9TELE
ALCKARTILPVAYQCSCWYWSTVNPLRRCKYTCTTHEVRPPVPEKPAEEILDKGENSTIAHSPCAQSESDAQEVDVAHSRTTTPSFSAPLPKPDQGSKSGDQVEDCSRDCHPQELPSPNPTTS